MSTVYSTACATCQQVDHRSRTYNPEIAWVACIGARSGLPMNFVAGGELDLWWLEEHLGHDVRVIDEYGSLGTPVPDVSEHLPARWPGRDQWDNPRHRTWTDRKDTPDWTREPAGEFEL